MDQVFAQAITNFHMCNLGIEPEMLPLLCGSAARRTELTTQQLQ
jgi:hypothetical protein